MTDFSQLPLSDVHTHRAGRPDALLSVSPGEALHGHMTPGDISQSLGEAILGCPMPYSISLYPWHVTGQSLQEFRRAVDICRDDPRFMAIGECGLDNRCGTAPALQREAFALSLQAAARLGKPVVVHCVGMWEEMLRTVSDEFCLLPASDRPQVLVHGFRKGPQLALRLVAAGCCISLGEKFNPETARAIPASRLFFETDESEADIWEIRKKILSLREN